MENYKQLLSDLYQEHAPEKIDQIDYYLEKYKGKEKQFYITQKAKYANKKSVTDSKKILADAMARINKKKEDASSKSISKDAPKEKDPIKIKETKVEKVVDVEEKTEPKKEIKPEQKEAPITKEEPVKKEDKEEPVKEKDVVNPPIIKRETKNQKVVVEPIPNEDKNPDLILSKKEESLVDDKKAQEIKDQKEDSKKAAESPSVTYWKKEKEKLKEEKEKLNSESEESDKKSLHIVWILGIVAILILVIAFAVYFFMYSESSNPKEESVNIQKVEIQETTLSDESEDETETVNSGENTEKQLEAVEAAPKQTTPVKTEPTPKKVSQTQPTAERIYNNDINRPAIFIGCFAVKSESLAQKKVKSLTELGLKGHYYWIPDIDPKGNAYFKVVVGPFNSLTEAYPSLTKTQERVNFDAYILIVD